MGDDTSDDLCFHGSMYNPNCPVCTERWFVYIVECSDGTYYTGISTDVKARVEAHSAGKGAKYTQGRGPVILRYEAICGSKATALRREHAIKKLKRSQKELLFWDFTYGTRKNMRCEHANENPAVCPCAIDCNCRIHMCAAVEPELEETQDFTVITLAIVQLQDGRQYPVNAAHLSQYIWNGELQPRGIPVERLPSFELIGRRITSLSWQDGHVVIGLSTKPDGKRAE